MGFIMNQKEDILTNIDILLLKDRTQEALDLFKKFMIEFVPEKCCQAKDILINILSMTRIWPDYQFNLNCIEMREIAFTNLQKCA